MLTHGHTRTVRVCVQHLGIIVKGVVNKIILKEKLKTLISQVNRVENSSDSDYSHIYTINHINKISSKNVIKLRINNCDIDT